MAETRMEDEMVADTSLLGSRIETLGKTNLEAARRTLDRCCPGLDETLKKIPLTVSETRGNPLFAHFKEARGPALPIPQGFGGGDADTRSVLQVNRALASRSPSLGIALAMHWFSVCTVVKYAMFGQDAEAADLLRAIAAGSLYLGSGFSEGRSGARPLDTTLQARREPGGNWRLSGRKRPCRLTYSMDFLTCGVTVEVADGRWQRGVALVPADSPGFGRKTFWSSPILAGAESDEVFLDDVIVPDQFVFLVGDGPDLDPVEKAGYIGLQLTLSATYLGVVGGLTERMIDAQKGSPEERGAIIAPLDAMAAAIDGLALALDAGDADDDLLASALAVRVATQSAVESAAMRGAEVLGGMAFMGTPDISYLLAAARAMAFHPPGRLQACRAIDQHTRGDRIDLT